MIDQETNEAEFWRGYYACKAKEPETKMLRNGKSLGYWSQAPSTPPLPRYYFVDITV